MGTVVLALAAAVFPSHVSAAPTRAVAQPVVCLQPLGEHDRAALPSVARGIEHLYGLEVRQLAARPLPRSAWYQPRRRYRAERILKYLDANVVPASGCDIVMGFTAADISVTKGSHADWGVFGYAWIGGKSGVVSTYRMRRRASPRATTMRAVKVMNHEIGHTLGLEHIAVRGCLMADVAGTVKTVDRATGLLCAEERRGMERVRGISLPTLARFDWSRVLGGEPVRVSQSQGPRNAR